jgi:undecaprenyl diphosphate synthase
VEASILADGAERQQTVTSTTCEGQVRHLAIIMDGNGRWAIRRGLPRVAGHRAGIEALRRVVRACPDLGIEVLTVYAFSTENWRRPAGEVAALMDLLVEFLKRETPELKAQGVQIRTIGDMSALPPASQAALAWAKRETYGERRLILNLALNYGGRHEIVRACRKLAREVQAGRLEPDDIDEACFARALDTADLPEPDLLIRASGEERLSNFLLWQLAYTEIWVTPTLWPDFDIEHLKAALDAFRRRDRRYGGLNN